ncbi:MAG: MFS transporter [Sphingomonadales bacterium]
MRWYYGWNVMAVQFICQGLVYGLGMFSFTFFVTPWMQEFGADRADLMWGTSLSIFGMGVLAPFVGRAMARVPVRVLTCAGIAMVVLGYLLISRATAAWQIVTIYALCIAPGLTVTGPLVGQALGAAWFRRNRGFAIGIGISGLAAGGLLVPPLSTALLLEFGWRQAHVILAALLAVTAIPMTWLVVRGSPAEAGVEPEAGGGGSPSVDTAIDERQWSMRDILGSRVFWILAIAFFTPNFALRGIQQNFGPYANDIGIGPQMAAWIAAASMGLQMLSKLVFGGLSDRWDPRVLYWIAMLCLGGAAALLIGRPSLPGVFGYVLLVGISAGEFSLFGVFCARYFGARDFGKVMGLLLFLVTAGAFGAVVAGWIRDVTGSYDWAYITLIVMLVPSMLAMLFLPARKPAANPAGAPA